MKKHAIALAMVLALVAPSAVLACSVTDVDGTFSCEGWEVVIMVQFSEGVDELCVDYAVSLLDFDQNPLEWTGERLCVERPETGEDTLRLVIQGQWQGHYAGQGFYGAIAAEVQGTDPAGFVEVLDCTVANDDMSWDGVKSQYR